MDRLTKIKDQVDTLYQAKHADRADWADWLYSHHIFVVAERAGAIAERFGGSPELAMAAGILHDVADAVMSRFDPRHQEESERIAREVLQTAGFSNKEIAIVIDDAMRLHSCRNHACPQTPEGKAMAAADAVVHLQSTFYVYSYQRMKENKTVQEIQAWALPKIERDFRNKIAFDDVREDVREDYERVKTFFSSLAPQTR